MPDRDTAYSAGRPPPVNGGGFAELLSDLVRDVTGLVRGESRLVRAELAEVAKGVAIGLEMMAVGGVLLLVAMLVLIQAGIVALAHYIGPAWASLAVGVAVALIGAILILRGRRNISAHSLIPERTIEQTSRDIRLAKEQFE